MRTMLYDLLQSKMAGLRLECKNPKHSYSAQISWEQDTIEGTNARIAQYWSVLDTGKCLSCNDGHDDFADLIPEGGGKKW